MRQPIGSDIFGFNFKGCKVKRILENTARMRFPIEQAEQLIH